MARSPRTPPSSMPTALTAEVQRIIAAFGGRQWDVAEALARSVVAKHKAHPFGWKALGAILAQTGRFAEAAEAAEQAVKRAPDDGEALNNLVYALERLGQTARAEKPLQRLVKLHPNDVEVHRKLGNLYLAGSRYAEAETAFRRAADLAPGRADILNNLGLTLHSQQRLTEAEAILRQALECDPGHPNALINLGRTLHDLRRNVEAEAVLRQVLKILPDDPRALYLLGFVVLELDRVDEAEALARRALAVDENLDMAHDLLGRVLRDRGRLEEARACFSRARDIEPRCLRFWDAATLLLPQIAGTSEEIAQWRARYEAGVAAFAAAPFTWPTPEGVAAGPLFYLPYHNHDDRPVLEALASAVRERVPSVSYQSPHLRRWRHRGVSGRRIRVGFLSMLLHTHTIGKLMQGCIRNLDRARFEIVLLHAPGGINDAFRCGLDACADRTVNLPRDLAAQQKMVADECLDILFFPDIGMDLATYFLAYGRYAPVQMVTWGHPITTGLSTVDYFVSADSIEADGAETYYSEHLVRLDRLPTYYQPQVVPKSIPTREAMGLPAGVRLYGCPQTLFKFHPEFDAVLHDIVQRDPDGRIVIVKTSEKFMALLFERWRQNCPGLAERVLVLNKMDVNDFMALLSHVDVLLDPIHFGSGNTLYEAMVYGTPIVTWPGRFMRGRIVAGAYRQMKIVDAPIADDIADYAPLAVALAQDGGRREALAQELRDGAARDLFADDLAVRQMEALFEEAVSAALGGERLPTGSRPG